MALRAESANCDRARAWASIRLDGEISELEDAFLEAHLRRCAECSEYEQTMRGAVLAALAALERLGHPSSSPAAAGSPYVRPRSPAAAGRWVAAVVGISAVLSTQSAKGPASPAAKSPVVGGRGQRPRAAPHPAGHAARQPPAARLRVGQFGAVTSRVSGPAL